MERLLKSSKFWVLVLGAVGLLAGMAFGPEKVKESFSQLAAIYALAAPLVYNVMTGIEDALSDGQITLEEIIEMLVEVLNENKS